MSDGDLELLPERDLTHLFGHDALGKGGRKTFGDLAGLSAIAKQIVAAADVVDVFVYDTTKDSDGGAWRDRCSHLAWFKETLNTATRGATRKHPQKALVVARAASVAIYDLDVPSCPMWKVFDRFSTSVEHKSVAAINGLLIIGFQHATPSFGGCAELDFIADYVELHRSSPGACFSQRGVTNYSNGNGYVVDPNVVPIVSAIANGVAATVLPGTPIDPVRGLPNPTIAVGTAGGVSVIHWDGRVCNSALTTPATSIGWAGDLLVYDRGGYVIVAHPSHYAVSSFSGVEYRNNLIPPMPSAAANRAVSSIGRGKFALGSSAAALTLLHHEAVQAASAIVSTTSKYTTGHMIGDTKLALSASAADLTTLVGATPLNEDGSSVVNWTPSTANVSVASVDGQIEVTNNGAGFATAQATVVPGARYRLFADWPQKQSGGCLYVGTSPGSTVHGGLLNPGSGQVFYFTPTVSPIYVSIGDGSSGTGAVNIYDNIRIDRVAEDRSVAGNHPVIVGSVTREVVAAGADLAAYGGFSASNYLEVPYSSAFDFGTGDFSVSLWAKLPNSLGGHRLFEKNNPAAVDANKRLLLFTSGGNVLGYFGASYMSAAHNVASNAWAKFVFLRRSGVGELWVNDVRVATMASGHDMTFVTAVCRLGIGITSTGENHSQALPRISATAPTPAQIRAMYEAERPLFQPGAKCLLSGSDNVQGLSYDDTTDLLYVAKAAGGTDVFKGLERVGSITMASDAGLTSNDHRGVSAKDGVVSIRTPNGVYASAPAVPLRPKLLGHNGGPPLYDRDEATFEGVTTDATPKVIAKFPLAKGERGVFTLTVRASQYADGAAYASYVYRCHAYRPEEGNVALRGVVTETILGESNAAMAATITANTTTQTLDVTATGLAATNLVWTVEMERA